METIHISDDRYPQMMRSYIKAPSTLYCEGDTSLLNSQCIAVIGTREPSEIGRINTRAIAAYFASIGYTIVSGLAKGCDTAAHEGALSVGGKTIAILGTPLGNIYPRENTQLAKQIVDNGGLLFTEYITNMYAPKRFFERDHLQAAMSLAVIPVQAGAASGTLHTVKSAIAQHRLLFLPIPIRSDEQKYPDKYAGIQQFIRMGHTTFGGKKDYPVLLERLLAVQ